jgi:DNA-binding GntR family transcriptional regulator
MTIQDMPIVKPRTMSAEVADMLRTAIRNGSLPAGTRLVEQDVAEKLGVSRVPVREAIQVLVEEGLVRKSPHRGAYVYLPSITEIDEISSLRVVLERFVVERVIERWNDEHQQRLLRIVGEMRSAMAAGNYQGVFEQDYAYHYALWEIADHAILLEVASSLRSRISRFLYEATRVLPDDKAELHVDSHGVLIDLINAGQVEAALTEVTKHVLDGKKRILTYCRLDPTNADGGEPGPLGNLGELQT